MCGICALASNSDISLSLYKSLLALEYRGYDSCGMAVINSNKINYRKNVGEVAKVNEVEKFSQLRGNLGIAHTRWATHGGVTKANSHPHFSNDKNFAIVHNGIVVNYSELKEQLVKKGYKFISGTDTEVVVNLIQEFYKTEKTLEKAFVSTIDLLEGSFSIVLCSTQDKHNLYAVKKDAPLVIGLGNKENFIASDPYAFIAKTRQVIYLDDYEYIIVSNDNYVVKSLKTKKKLSKKETTLTWTAENIQKGGFSHFMIKEIFDQPQTILNSINLDKKPFEKIAQKFLTHKQSFFVGVGTTYYVSIIASYLFSNYAGIYVPAISSDEFSNLLTLKKEYHALYLSQSGETYDTREALKSAKSVGMASSGIINVMGSSISRIVDDCIYQSSGPEISVVSTKAAISQIMILLRLALEVGKRKKHISQKKSDQIENAIPDFSKLISNQLNEQSGHIRRMAYLFSKVKNWLFLGRDIYYPIAMESALKMKEVTYLHAEGMSAGFLKHGTLSMVDNSIFCLFFLPPKNQKKIYESSVIALEEVKARNGMAIGFIEEGNKIAELMDYSIIIPPMKEDFVPFYELIMAQLFSYYSALYLKRNIDKPRNLAKSVTTA